MLGNQKPNHAHYCLDGHGGIDDWGFLTTSNTWAVERKRNLLAIQT